MSGKRLTKVGPHRPFLGHDPLDMTQLYILKDESQINESHRPFDQLRGLK